ncbi:kinase-like domain [Cordyceps militaris]|uniref:Kinase-like domain n=1 Tax=Cordyceps militaris TaxID=73501 RepID=A0A2H4SJG1_CORMI|nr:kinase-like domain [Cordyceps militaris]
MVFSYLFSLLPQWPTAVQFLSGLWRRILRIRTLPDIERRFIDDAPKSYPTLHSEDGQAPWTVATYGASKSERDAQRQAYIEAIQVENVLKLASSRNEGRDCIEFRKREHGSFNVCFFVEFPFDGTKWVVRFPICPVLHEPWRKLQAEIATMEYIHDRTTIRIPRVYGYGSGGELDPNNDTGLPFVILEYISGRPLDPKQLSNAPTDALARFYADLGDILSQLRAQEFEYAGALIKDEKGEFVITCPNSVDLNSVQLQGMRKNVRRQSTAVDFAMCHYETLVQRLSMPAERMDEDDVQLEVFALEDFKLRLFQFINPSWNFEPFVLSHGDLRPSNIIVGEDLSIAGIIDWEWSGTVPLQFFTPPLWLSGYEVSTPRDGCYQSEYAKLYQALLAVDATSAARCTLASEWGHEPSWRLFLPAALLQHHLFMTTYYLAVFPQFYEGVKRDDKLTDFFNSFAKFREVVQKKVEASEKYTQHLIAHGLLAADRTAEDL